MQNYFSGFLVSLVLHMGLVLSFTNFFLIDDLYSLNKIEPMPAYLVFEKPQVLKKINKNKIVNKPIYEKPEIASQILKTADTGSELENIKIERDLLLKEIINNETKSSVEEISFFSNLIRDQVIMNWKQPSSAQKGMKVEIVLTLVPTGEIIQVSLANSSGNQAFDNSALNAIQKVSKFENLDMGRKLFDTHFRKFTLVFNPEN